MDGQQLYCLIQGEINQARMVDHVEKIGQWHRYTGAPQGEAFVDDLTTRLETLGIPYTAESYQAYTSLPCQAELELDGGEKLRILGDVFSREVRGMRGELVYDRWSEQKRLSPREQLERLAAFRGKLVLSRSGGGEFAEQIARVGGLGLLHISSSPGGYIHHSNIGAVWGTPCPDAAHSLGCIPSAGISMEDGKMLAARLEQSPVKATLSIAMETGVRTSRMVAVDISGKQPGFVLLNGHYDSWYEGITDNGGSDAILLELARAFWTHRDQLERGVRIAWWSGHSDARYAGSAWYCDHHWRDLDANCVATVNLDLTGCKLARQIRARTTCMEGESLTAGLIREFTGMEAKPYIPMIRGADQSFWGVHVPIHIMFKYEPVDEERVAPCPSGGPWWHTDQDTLDKLDPEILLRDARLNGKLVCLLTNSGCLPVDISGFLEKMKGFLKDIQPELTEGFSLAEVFDALERLAPCCRRLEERLRADPAGGDEILKRTAGELVRLVYSQGSPYQHDPANPYPPFGVLARAKGMTGGNTPEELFLFQKTAFCRACNRLVGQIDEIIRQIEQFLSR